MMSRGVSFEFLRIREREIYYGFSVLRNPWWLVVK
jgi:hypothetical protein